VAVGETLPAALEVAIVVEYVARIHYRAMNIGDSEPMAESDLVELRDIFDEYGQH